jgi:ubiquinone/menaquinone biosynthesis C-methylase UbiE
MFLVEIPSKWVKIVEYKEERGWFLSTGDPILPPVFSPAALFQSVSDDSRLRLLRLLGREELNVRELVRITGLSQPRVSKHLAVLREQNWITQRREGTWSWYRAVAPKEFGPGEQIFRQITRAADMVPEAREDDGNLGVVLGDRQARAKDFFSGIADRWDTIRQEYEHPDIRIGAIGALVAPDLKILDIGTGTGAMLPVFAAVAGTVVALDNSEAMLARARALCQSEGLGNVEFCNADVGDIPFDDAVFDACNCSMVLHHVVRPEAALAEMTRVVRPGGKVMVTAFCRHEQTWMRDELAHQRLGFDKLEMEELFTGADLTMSNFLVRGRSPGQENAGPTVRPSGRKLQWPEVFLATGVKVNE